MVRRVQLPPLHQAALAGDDDAVRHALRSGATVDDLDPAGRSAVMCAIAGENWKQLDASDASCTPPVHLRVLRTVVGDAQVSLHTLNAPQRAYRGVTPLGMAAWLDSRDAVRVLLEESAGCVAVDATDAHGATPLMYAARDGRLDVVQLLLRHGARPDFGDANHRTAIQFALPFPQIVWLCESALRRHRCQVADRAAAHLLRLARSALPSTRIFVPPPESAFSADATARATAALIQAVRAADIASLHTLLFPPATAAAAPTLVNLPDAHGWSPLHHCAAAPAPSGAILDALFAAGAVPLFTAREQWTPLHCFAQAGRHPPRAGRRAWGATLARAVAQLVRRTPLSARDRDDETCLHVAAERGACVEVLVLLLECDADASVRALRNARGLTALEVCRPEFRAAFGADAEQLRSGSALSCHTIRPSESVASLLSSASGSGSRRRVPDARDSDPASVLDNVDISASATQLLANLRLTAPAPAEPHAATPFHRSVRAHLVREAGDIAAVVCAHYRAGAAEAAKDVRALRAAVGRAQMRVDRAGREVEAAMRARGLALAAPRRRFDRWSEDSQLTAVSESGEAPAEDAWQDLHSKSSERVNELGVEHLDKGAYEELQSTRSDVEPAKPIKRPSGTMKLRAWMKRKLQLTDNDAGVEHPVNDVVDISRSKLEVIPEQQEAPVAPSPPPSPSVAECDLSADDWVDGLLRTSHSMLQAASRDLERVRECIASAEHFISIVERSAARVERVVGRALKKREAAIAELRASSDAACDDGDGDDFFVQPGLLSPKSSIASLSSVYSARSSCVSLAATLAEQEDDDTRVVRRLLMRKIETGASGAQAELEKGVNSVRTVKEVIRSAKKRAYVV
ncbi:hypothetical protein GGX14DRAFT_585918 [Mycena pura]|uniref:Ankyrin repeat protein n=1 Tax=Mycena pura TaxID=153505 RepID=A0AAD6VTS8_9AGAR|nr:hypothetical protein GGX14DRAFT_585918 [Mycena pura]